MSGCGCLIMFVFMPPLLLGWPLYVIFNEIRKQKKGTQNSEDTPDENKTIKILADNLSRRLGDYRLMWQLIKNVRIAAVLWN